MNVPQDASNFMSLPSNINLKQEQVGFIGTEDKFFSATFVVKCSSVFFSFLFVCLFFFGHSPRHPLLFGGFDCHELLRDN